MPMRRRAPPASARGRARADIVSLTRSDTSPPSPAGRAGTRTDQPLSRKCRLSSPRIVGTANDENAVVAVGIEAVDRLQQAERRDLDEVVELLARRAGSAARAGARAGGSARRAPRAPRCRRRGGSARAAAGPRERGPPGHQADMLRLRFPADVPTSPRLPRSRYSKRRGQGRGNCCDGSLGRSRVSVVTDEHDHARRISAY